MTDADVVSRLRQLYHLYKEHADNQNLDTLKERNKLHLELSDKFTALKPYIKKHSRLQWYEPVYTYAISGNLEYIEEVRKDLSHIVQQINDQLTKKT
ncbi:MAG: hypothetical protein JRI89_10585 [Deltaproteobacteria bacterium]|nr:hypothetical protein [Deltaproteobacteria bacterium]